MDVEVSEVAPGVWHARSTHVGWVLVVDGDDVALVDTGYPGDRDRVIASLEKIGRSPADVSAVLLTHAHPDHLGSARYLSATTGARVLAHEREVPNATGERIEQVSLATLLSRAWRPDVAVWARDVLALKAVQVERLDDVEPLPDGPLDLPGRPSAVPTPGHTSGHVVVHLPQRAALLVGDALMTEHALARSRGPALLPDFFNHDSDQARASLATLAALEADVLVPGHGPAYHGSPAQAVAAATTADASTAGYVRRRFGRRTARWSR